MILHLVREEPLPSHIRPFSLARDLEELASLLEIAFGPELATTGNRMVEEMRRLAQLGPMLYMMPGFASMMGGYVWREDGRLVGNVTITPEEEEGVWSMSNVAVLPEYRGRGIGGQLVDVAIAHIRRRGGRRIFLDVRHDNALAVALYQRRGFICYDTTYEMGLPATKWPLVVGTRSERFRTPSMGDGRRLFRLAIESTPVLAQCYKPLKASDYARGWRYWFRSAWRLAFRSEDVIEIVGPAKGEMAAYAGITIQLSQGQHRLRLLVRPEERGQWEEALLGELFARLRYAPRQRIIAEISASHPEAVAALRKYGFEEQRVLDEMVLSLR